MDHLFSACRGNRLGLVKEIIEHGCPIDLTESDSGDTPLLIACEKGFTQLLEYCLQQKAAIDPHPDFGYTGFQVYIYNFIIFFLFFLFLFYCFFFFLFIIV